MKELDEKYKEKKQQKSEEEKAKLGGLVEQSKEKWKNEEKKSQGSEMQTKREQKRKIKQVLRRLERHPKKSTHSGSPKETKIQKDEETFNFGPRRFVFQVH